MTGEIDKTAEYAARWLMREDRGLDPREREEFDEWLNASPAHRVTYLRLQSIWQRADRLAALRNPRQQLTRTTRLSVFHPHVLRWAAATVLIACVSVAGYLELGLRPTNNPSVTYMTAVGQRETHKFADGTVVELNTSTRLLAKEGGSKRTVILERGEAYFDVVHNEQRPFVVIAGDRVITDVGTRFSVRKDGASQLRIVVKDGRIRIDSPDTALGPMPVFAGPNDVVTVSDNETLVSVRTAQDISRQLSWKNGILVLEHTTLADAAAEFNRYNKKQIVVEGRARDLRIGGSFAVNHIDAFALLIQQGFNVRVTNEPKRIVISDGG